MRQAEKDAKLDPFGVNGHQPQQGEVQARFHEICMILSMVGPGDRA